MNALSIATAVPELQLPWESSGREDGRFARILRAMLLALAVLALVIPVLPLQELTREQREALPPHLARVILEKKTLPEPAPVETRPKPTPKPKPKPIEPSKPKPVTRAKEPPRPELTVDDARQVAAVSGVLAFQDDLAAMRDSLDPAALDQTQLSRGTASAATVERAIITANRKASSGGIQTAALSRNSGGRALSGRETTKVHSTIASTAKAQTSASQSAQLGGRSDESIRRVMDRNKGAIFAIYNRALRQDPLLEGKLVFEMVIDASGNVAELNLLSSELADARLTSKILSRIRMIRFDAEDVITTRVNYSFDFLPYT